MQAQSRRNSGEAIATPETKKDTDSYESRSTHTHTKRFWHAFAA